jgi:hypothetical protein
MGLARYYFDIRNADQLFSDTEGTWLAGGMDAIRTEALIALGDYARNVVPTDVRRRLTIEVRDEHSRSILTAEMILVIEVLALEDRGQDLH